MTENKPTAKARAEQLMSHALKGKDLHHIFNEMSSKQILISGQTIPHWKSVFSVKIPTDNLNPQVVREYDVKLINLTQDATYYYNLAQAKAQMMKHSGESIYQTKYEELVKGYQESGKRLPAAATLSNLAHVEQSDIDSAQTIADIEVKFWKNILDSLAKCHSILKNAAWMLSAEMKALDSERNLDAQERKYTQGGSR